MDLRLVGILVESTNLHKVLSKLSSSTEILLKLEIKQKEGKEGKRGKGGKRMQGLRQGH